MQVYQLLRILLLGVDWGPTILSVNRVVDGWQSSSVGVPNPCALYGRWLHCHHVQPIACCMTSQLHQYINVVPSYELYTLPVCSCHVCCAMSAPVTAGAPVRPCVLHCCSILHALVTCLHVPVVPR